MAEGGAADARATDAQPADTPSHEARPADARSREPRPDDSRPAVLITGASKGIGEACALRLARDGFRVYAGVRSDADGAALVRAGGDRISPVQLDITDAAQIAAAAARIGRETGARGLQALVNNAGIAIAGPLEFLPLDELRRQFDINVVAQIAVTQACLPLLRRSRAVADPDHRAGRIVFMSSISGRSALPFIGAYAASKHALEAAADALRLELRPFGLRVSLVEPGVIATPIWQTALAAGAANLERMPPEVWTYYGGVIEAMQRRLGGKGGPAGAVGKAGVAGTRGTGDSGGGGGGSGGGGSAAGMGGLAPERVAEIVSHALTARRPRIRYIVGGSARMRVLLEWAAPTRIRDWAIDRVVRKY